MLREEKKIKLNPLAIFLMKISTPPFQLTSFNCHSHDSPIVDFKNVRSDDSLSER